MPIIMVAFVIVRQGEYECQANENETSAVEMARVDRQKSDRVLAEICSPSIWKNEKIFDFEYKQYCAANNSHKA
jgi:hypothetical protein